MIVMKLLPDTNLIKYHHFQILTIDSETVIGSITRAWPGLWKQAFTSADNFGIRCKTILR